MNKFEKIAIIGAGTMGASIAQHFLMKGLPVTLMDQSTEGIERGRQNIMVSLEEAMKRRLISEDQFKQVETNLICTTDQSDLKDCDLIIEAVFEDLKVKQDLFKELENVVRPDCILASNTSSFLIEDIAKATKHPERVIGIHYFYHAAKNKLIEIIPGRLTNLNLAEQLVKFYGFHGKTPIIVKDEAGFAINRFFVPWLNEGARLLEEGFGTIEKIDQVARQVFGVGMGPFALMNATGVPIAMHAAEGLASKLGDFYKASKILCDQVERGNQWNEKEDIFYNNGSYNEEVIKSRLIAASLGVAAQMVAEGVIDATSTDLGTRAGLRWPFGPFELMNNIGVSVVHKMVENLFSEWNMPVPKFAFDTDQDVELDWVQAKIKGESGFVIFNLPDRMNALGEQVVRQLDQCFTKLDNNPDLKKIFFVGQGKAFIAGADVKFFVDCLANDDLDRIHRFAIYGQEVFKKIENSSKETCAFVDGLTLGGGLELALACDYRVGTKNSLLAFPETSIGIYPGLGGTQRSLRLIGKGVAKFMVATGQMLKSDDALAYGLVDQLIDPLYDVFDLNELSLGQKQAGRKAQDETETLFTDFNGEYSDDHPYAKILSRKAPLALTIAMKLMDEGAELSLEEGLKRELEDLPKIFGSSDALQGLESVIKGFKPKFTGQ